MIKRFQLCLSPSAVLLHGHTELGSVQIRYELDLKE